MSAQDDVLAAFGKPSQKPHDEAAEKIESAEAIEPTAETEVTEVTETSAGGAVDDKVSAPEGGGASEPAPAPAPADALASEVQGSSGPGEMRGEGVGAQESELSLASAPGEQPPTLPDPAPAQPYLDPAAFFAQLQAEAAPKPKRRWPRLLLRYTSALVVAGAIGAGTAYAICLPRRTDVPFLATPSDGRYTFPFLVKPAPPAGKPAPAADDDATQIHYADLRQYLLPSPRGAVRAEDGWESVADFESSLGSSDVSGRLNDAGLRRVARRGWTTPDGQHTVVELAQFPDHQSAYDLHSMLELATPAKAGKAETVVPVVTVRLFGDETSNLAVHKFDQVDGLRGQVARRVAFQSGDVVAIVTTTAPAGVPDTPTEQVVMLQAELLR